MAAQGEKFDVYDCFVFGISDEVNIHIYNAAYES